ncbi:MAG: alpha-D-ribose 1-methylphosphonate 5-triphosphate diphosphatase [Planctomycetota bacterium]
MPTNLIHATVVTEDDCIEDSAVVIDEQGAIAAVDPDCLPQGRMYDCRGGLLMPGIIDLHSDHVETVIEARPGVFFPVEVALPQIDTINAAAGITTAFHAVSFTARGNLLRRIDNAKRLTHLLHDLDRHGSIEHRVHCRYEVTQPDALPAIEAAVEQGHADLVSIMDHSPGQGQFKSMEAFVAYYSAHHRMTPEEAEAFGLEAQRLAREATDGVRDLLDVCHARGVTTASHDDDSAERVNLFRDLGVRICEFPINLEAAHCATRFGMPTVLGAPNILRGGSQSGSMRALDGILAEVCDCLCSDYAPWTILQAVLALPELTTCSLPEAVALATSHPAAAVALDDRGRVAPGLRADLVLVDRSGEQPAVRSVWCAGEQVYQQRVKRQGAPRRAPAVGAGA